MSNLFEELKRRNVVRVGIAYLVVGWVKNLGPESMLTADSCDNAVREMGKV